MTKVLALGSAIIGIAAGLYLLDTQAAADDSLIESFMHGVGIYFIGKGLFIGASLYLQDDIRTMMRGRLQEDARDKGTAATGGLQGPEGV